MESSISLQDAVGCKDKDLTPKISQRGDYWVLYNYVPMTVTVKCWESITYTTHADFTFLDNLEPLLERWQAPVSIAMYAPGTDFQPTIQSIKYLRNCASPLVSQLVTFHLYFSSKHVPKVVSIKFFIFIFSYLSIKLFYQRFFYFQSVYHEPFDNNSIEYLFFVF